MLSLGFRRFAWWLHGRRLVLSVCHLVLLTVRLADQAVQHGGSVQLGVQSFLGRETSAFVFEVGQYQPGAHHVLHHCDPWELEGLQRSATSSPL